MKVTTRLVLAVITGLIWIFMSTTSGAQEQVTKLRFASFFPSNSKYVALENEWCKEVEKRTGGRVKVTLYAGQTLAPVTQAYDSMVRGSFDVGNGVLAYHPGRFPLTEILDLPLGYRDAIQATGLGNAVVKKFSPKEFDEVKLLLLHTTGPTSIQTNKKISSLKEIKGLRIKSSGISSKIVEILGGTAVTIPIADTYDGIKRGIADGALEQQDCLIIYRIGEVVKFDLRDPGMANATTCWMAMNKQKWNSLPKDVQEIIEKINDEYIPKFGKAHFDMDKDGEAFAAQHGVTVVRVSKAEEECTRAKVKPLLEEYVKNMKAKGIPGDQVWKFCHDYLAAH
jgi:TRAP-type C4-dicarboxylate transport system substrate-binding protein